MWSQLTPGHKIFPSVTLWLLNQMITTTDSLLFIVIAYKSVRLKRNTGGFRDNSGGELADNDETVFSDKGTDIDCQCLGSQEHICCFQVVWGQKIKDLSPVEFTPNFSGGSVGFFSCSVAFVGSPAQLSSHFLVCRGHPLLHHNYYIQWSSCATAERSQRFSCRAMPIFTKSPPLLKENSLLED